MQGPRRMPKCEAEELGGGWVRVPLVRESERQVDAAKAEAAKNGIRPKLVGATRDSTRLSTSRMPEFDPHKPLVPQVIALRKQVLELMKEGVLSADDMADYHIFLVASEAHLEKRKVHIANQWQLTQAQARAGGRKQQEHAEKLERLRAAEVRFNQEAKVHNQEKDWLRALPAYQQARYLALDSGQYAFDANGKPYNVQEQQAEEEELFGLSFEEVLRQEKDAGFGPSLT